MAGGGDAEGGEEEGDDLAAEWAAMADSGSDDGYSESSRVLDQAEIDSLLGFQEGDDVETERSGIEAIIDAAWCPTNVYRCWRSCSTVSFV